MPDTRQGGEFGLAELENLGADMTNSAHDADIMRKRIVCKLNFMRKRIFVYPRRVAASGE